MVRALLLVLSAVFAGACAPKIGDGCGNSSNCSINGDRFCDTTQPGGVCIIYDCEADRCPDDAVCARFRPEPRRSAVTACMKRCNQDSDCRSGDGYRCIDPQTYDNGAFATVLDQNRPSARFCVFMTQ